PGHTRSEVHVASFGHSAVVKQFGCVLREELIAPEALVTELPAAADALGLTDPEILAHLLGPAVVQRPIDRVLGTAVEHGDQGLSPQISDGPARHRAAGIYVGELDVHLAPVAPVVQEVLGAAPPGAEVVLGSCPGESQITGASAWPERADPQILGRSPEGVG